VINTQNRIKNTRSIKTDFIFTHFSLVYRVSPSGMAIALVFWVYVWLMPVDQPNRPAYGEDKLFSQFFPERLARPVKRLDTQADLASKQPSGRSRSENRPQP
jgi:hypothetical protein